MEMVCPCRFINCTRHTALLHDVDMGEAMHVLGHRVYEKSLHLSLNFSVNIKQL